MMAVAVGVVGGIYGIGGGSILAPILVGSGLAVAEVAPAALASTFVTSIVGAATYALLATNASGSSHPTGASDSRADSGDVSAATSARASNRICPNVNSGCSSEPSP